MNKEFLYHLHDTIILLGGETHIAKMVEHLVTDTEIDELRRYNARLMNSVKDRVVGVHTISVHTTDGSQ